jgi:hypothetical protein
MRKSGLLATLVVSAIALLPAFAQDTFTRRPSHVDDIISRFSKGRAENILIESLPVRSSDLSAREKSHSKRWGDRSFYVVREKDGSVRTLSYVPGKDGPDTIRTIDTGLADAIRRLRQPEKYVDGWKKAISYEFKKTPVETLSKINETLPDPMGKWSPGYRVGPSTLARAIRNAKIANMSNHNLTSAIELLSRDSNYSDQKVSVAIRELSLLHEQSYRYLGGSKVTTVSDLKDVTPELFYENIHYAINAKHEFTWSKELSWDRFLAGVVNHRQTNEPVSRWRRHFYEVVAPLIKDSKNSSEALKRINALGHATFFYKQTGWDDCSIPLMLKTQQGRCEDMTNYVRALASAASIDTFELYTPAWPDRNNNHAWLGNYSADGSLESRMACEPHKKDPKRYMDQLVAKVYARDRGGVRDVTTLFTTTSNISRKVVYPDHTLVYLNVFNGGKIITVAKSIVRGGEFSFDNVGCKKDILYVLSRDNRTYSSSSRPLIIGSPFLLSVAGVQEFCDDSKKGIEKKVVFHATDIDYTPKSSSILAMWIDSNYVLCKQVRWSAVKGRNVARCDLEIGRLYQFIEKSAYVGRPFSVSSSGKIVTH